MTTFISENKKFAIFFILIIAFFLRVYRLGYHDFWYDEAWTVNYAKYPWENWNAPLYWIILHFWTKLFGFSEFSLRSPSLIFSLLSVTLTFLLGKRLFNKKVGILASLFIGFSPFHLWYAQEARDYSMVLFLGTLSSYLFFKATKEERLKLWLSFVLVSMLGLYTNYFYIFLLISQGLYFVLLRRWRLNFKEIICFLVIALGFIPYLNRFLTKFYYVWGGFWIPKPSLKSLIITIENFILGYNASSHLYLISDLLLSLFFICAVLNFKKKELRESLIFCLLLFIFPILAVFIFSKLFFPIYIDRGLIIFSPYYYLLLGLGIDYLGDKQLKKIILSAFLVILLISLSSYYRNLMPAEPGHHIGVVLKKPYKPALRFIENNFKLGDIIMHTNSSSQEVFEFYSRNKEITQDFLFASKMIDPNWDRPYESGVGIVSVEELASINAKRIWVVSCDWQRGKELDKNSKAVNSEMSKLYKLDLSLEFDGLWVYRYLKL